MKAVTENVVRTFCMPSSSMLRTTYHIVVKKNPPEIRAYRPLSWGHVYWLVRNLIQHVLYSFRAILSNTWLRINKTLGVLTFWATLYTFISIWDRYLAKLFNQSFPFCILLDVFEYYYFTVFYAFVVLIMSKDFHGAIECCTPDV